VVERGQPIGRRQFIRAGAGGGAVMSILHAGATPASAQREAMWEVGPAKKKYGKPFSIDMHAHWTPTAYLKAQSELGRKQGNDHFLYYDLEKRKQWMDEREVQIHVLTFDGGAPFQWATPQQGDRLAQIMNDAALEAHKAYPDRFIGAIAVSVRDPALALKELNRMAGQPGMKAIQLPDSYDRRDYVFEPAFEPVLARCEELGYPLLFHQMGGVESAYGGDRMAGGKGMPNLTAALDAPFSRAALATKFIVTGTLDKFPKLEVVLPHAGGAFPYLAGRVEHFLYHYPERNMPSPRLKLARPFKEYIRRFHYDYLAYYPEALRFLIDLVGTDRIVVGTDLYAARDIEYPNAMLDQFDLADADLDRILRGNAARLLKL
jgi:aminocarboxymuconate-semialdehyde decarboxylase